MTEDEDGLGRPHPLFRHIYFMCYQPQKNAIMSKEAIERFVRSLDTITKDIPTAQKVLTAMWYHNATYPLVLSNRKAINIKKKFERHEAVEAVLAAYAPHIQKYGISKLEKGVNYTILVFLDRYTFLFFDEHGGIFSYATFSLSSTVAEFRIYSMPGLAELVSDTMQENCTDEGIVVFDYIMTDNGMRVNATLSKHGDLNKQDIFYPSLNMSVEEYAKAFDKSKSRIAFFHGPVGTGKTSLALAIAKHLKRDITVCSDLKTLRSPEFISSLKRCEEPTMLLIDDCDDLLVARASGPAVEGYEGNRIMSNYLTLAAGAGQYDIKLMIASNLDTLDKVDSALTRPGRCFDIRRIGRLNQNQAENVASAYGITDLDIQAQNDWSLAEIMNFNSDINVTFRKNSAKKQGIGFVG